MVRKACCAPIVDAARTAIGLRIVVRLPGVGSNRRPFCLLAKGQLRKCSLPAAVILLWGSAAESDFASMIAKVYEAVWIGAIARHDRRALASDCCR